MDFYQRDVDCFFFPEGNVNWFLEKIKYILPKAYCYAHMRGESAQLYFFGFCDVSVSNLDDVDFNII